jgi:hypothetical protein
MFARFAREGVTTALLVLAAGGASAQETPQALIRRAIQAHGGHERLARARAEKMKLRGTLHLGQSTVPFTNDTTVQLPGQFKSVVQLNLGDRIQTVVHVLDGDRVQVTLNGRPQPAASGQFTQLRQTLQLEQALRLVPLLTDPTFTLAPLGEATVNGRPALGVCVRGGAQRDLKLWFDKQTALVVKTEHLLDGAGGKDVRQECSYSDYRSFNGRLRPGKVIAYRDGKKLMEADLVEVRPFEQLPAAEFAP